MGGFLSVTEYKHKVSRLNGRNHAPKDTRYLIVTCTDGFKKYRSSVLFSLSMPEEERENLAKMMFENLKKKYNL